MPWLTASETADRYRITTSGLMKQRAEGRPPGSLGKRAGKRVLWSSLTLDAFDGVAEPDTFGPSHAMVLELQAVNKLLRKMNAQLGTITRYLDRFDSEIIVHQYRYAPIAPEDGIVSDPHPPDVHWSFYRGDGPAQFGSDIEGEEE